MGTVEKRAANPIEVKRKKEQKQTMLDAQEISVNNAEQSMELQEVVADLNEQLAQKEQQILDLQEILVGLTEGKIS